MIFCSFSAMHLLTRIVAEILQVVFAQRKTGCVTVLGQFLQTEKSGPPRTRCTWYDRKTGAIATTTDSPFFAPRPIKWIPGMARRNGPQTPGRLDHHWPICHQLSVATL